MTSNLAPRRLWKYKCIKGDKSRSWKPVLTLYLAQTDSQKGNSVTDAHDSWPRTECKWWCNSKQSSRTQRARSQAEIRPYHARRLVESTCCPLQTSYSLQVLSLRSCRLLGHQVVIYYHYLHCPSEHFEMEHFWFFPRPREAWREVLLVAPHPGEQLCCFASPGLTGLTGLTTLRGCPAPTGGSWSAAHLSWNHGGNVTGQYPPRQRSPMHHKIYQCNCAVL